MAWNPDDYSRAPWGNGVMELTHEEVVHVKEEVAKIKDAFVPDRFTVTPTSDYVVSHFNELTNYEEAINGDTYNATEGYNPEYNTQGISPEYPNTGYIVPEPVEEEPEEETEEPTEETPTEPEEEETPAEEQQPEEESPVEEEQPETMAEEITAEEEK